MRNATRDYSLALASILVDEDFRLIYCLWCRFKRN
ncbi:unknown [Clostridium sp. CAG:354]|nr:unknown [Clostridium sp. CAG:354]